MKIRILVLILCALTQGCTYVDDYMLGKDNTPQPKELKEIQPRLKWHKAGQLQLERLIKQMSI